MELMSDKNKHFLLMSSQHRTVLSSTSPFKLTNGAQIAVNNERCTSFTCVPLFICESCGRLSHGRDLSGAFFALKHSHYSSQEDTDFLARDVQTGQERIYVTLDLNN